MGAPEYFAPPPPRPPLTTYIPTGFEPYAPPPPSQPVPLSASASGHGGHAAPPMPVPLSQIGFPLDPTRYYLLGQLEYYLSPQNMAQDFFLRKRMDSKGWIPIDLLASFNRVKQLTQEYQLVREVLMLSSLVQVREHFVRMGGWEQFVLPDAPKSVVEAEVGEDSGYSSYIPQHQHTYPHQQGEDGGVGGVPGVPQQEPGEWSHTSGVGVEGEEEGEEEDEEDDVVFVMGQDEGEGMWSHEKRA
ncbi:winged helix DNA-binding domain-containing protein [Macrolepiota fuliginosa MF-IS2]|uniref:Winged helix DNA-binding domain-containing protein n=1 Tax=Macrolepiota fuliginosa MF-IS2 TaxID=1400762 RepID=A0A9P5XAT4_9AGAR|nr:winged helix DNA-binding domain-containing protein [Macrolepiota fuliginosa MF-IS2]